MEMPSSTNIPRISLLGQRLSRSGGGRTQLRPLRGSPVALEGGNRLSPRFRGVAVGAVLWGPSAGYAVDNLRH